MADLEADDGLCGVMEANLGLASYWWILPFVQVSSDWWRAGHVTMCTPLWLDQLMSMTNLPVVAAVCLSAPVLAADALQPGDCPELHHHPQHQHLLSQHQPLDLASVCPHCPHLLQDRSALLVCSWDSKDFLQIYYHPASRKKMNWYLLHYSSIFQCWQMKSKCQEDPWSISIYFCKVISTLQLPRAITWGQKWPSILKSGCTGPNNLPWSIDKSFAKYSQCQNIW